MTNLDSVFKSGDITLPTKVHLGKAMVFPVVMYGCESWTVKKAECRRIDEVTRGETPVPVLGKKAQNLVALSGLVGRFFCHEGFTRIKNDNQFQF